MKNPLVHPGQWLDEPSILTEEVKVIARIAVVVVVWGIILFAAISAILFATALWPWATGITVAVLFLFLARHICKIAFKS